MILDARNLPEGHSLDTEICIVGAGAAGITLAREFVNTPFKVVLLESGGMKFDHKTQSLYQAENYGREYPSMEFTKRRQFGGSTVAWFGRCRPLDPLDFEKRSWVPGSGWPFSKSELDPYYARAKEHCQLPSDNYDVKADYFDHNGLQTKRFYFSPPTDFGETYRNEINNSHNINIFLHANAVHIAVEKDGTRAQGVKCRTLAGKTFHLSAKIVILAASALENTKLLLISRDVHSQGLGNQYDRLGRYFMEHPHIFTGVVETLPGNLPLDYTKLNYDLQQKKLDMVDAIGLREEVLKMENLLNACVFLVNRPFHKTRDLYYSDKLMGFIRLMETLQHSAPLNKNILPNMVDMIRNANSVASLITSAIRGRLGGKRRYTLRLQMETAPNPESRVTLSEKKDALGVSQIALSWMTSRIDTDSYQRFVQILHNNLHAAGMKTTAFRHDLSSDGWPVSMRPAKHHMGTTRMHKDEKQGVVNEHCQVHGMHNLYIAGGSVFPTSGMANPTLTIVALAVRLADRIKHQLSG